MRLDPSRAIVLALGVVLAAGCGAGDPAEPGPKPPGDETPGGQPDPGPPSIASPKANVRFLDANRLSRSFSKALGLKENELCNELGKYACVGFIHKISLLGTDPFLFGVNDPLPATTTSTPLVVERVATSGCVLRVARDREQQGKKHPVKFDGSIFDRLVVDAEKGTLDPAAETTGLAIDRLYVRALQRHPTAAETEAHRQLYRDVEALHGPKPADDWAVASCVAVLTSMESIFY